MCILMNFSTIWNGFGCTVYMYISSDHINLQCLNIIFTYHVLINFHGNFKNITLLCLDQKEEHGLKTKTTLFITL